MMIIKCPNCNKQFNVNSNLVPDAGRTMQCGSCNHTWFFNKISQVDNENEDFLLKNTIISKNIKHKTKTEKITFRNDKALIKYEDAKSLSLANLFSYFLVFLITFVALIILLDTFKNPLITVFPDLEFLLYNLFETLKDIILFLKDLL